MIGGHALIEMRELRGFRLKSSRSVEASIRSRASGKWVLNHGRMTSGLVNCAMSSVGANSVQVKEASWDVHVRIARNKFDR